MNSKIIIEAEKDYLVCIDSDGCAFNTMEFKHRRFFCPEMIREWKLQDIKEDVEEVWYFVNLYSKWRGINRFKGLLKVFELLKEKKSIKEKRYCLPDITSLKYWIDETGGDSQPALEEEVKENKNKFLKKTLAWSKAVNQGVAEMETDDIIFPDVKETIKKISNFADIAVVSSANKEALAREWGHYGLTPYVKVMAGQEMGAKADCIDQLKTGNYTLDNTIMLGDAPGDLRAAQENDVSFYPIMPGKEGESWQKFSEEAFNKFLSGDYKGDYQDDLIKAYHEVLTDKLPWE